MNFSTPRSLRSSLYISAALLAAPAAALADDQAPVQVAAADSGASLETIIVSARKRAENIQDVPVAVTAGNTTPPPMKPEAMLVPLVICGAIAVAETVSVPTQTTTNTTF